MRRRSFLRMLANVPLGAAMGCLASDPRPMGGAGGGPLPAADALTLFLCGDVMLGRAIDQILPHPSEPVLYEAHVRDTRDYLRLAERESGPIAHPVAWPYVWGDALAELARWRPAARIINLETSVTRNDAPWPDKPVQYRMQPGNVPCLTAAGIDCCVLSNNHVLDWQRPGLDETLTTLHRARIATVGAGADLAAAQAPAILGANGRRVLVFAAATTDSGVPSQWAATASRSGVHLLTDLTSRTLGEVAGNVRRHRRDGDCVVFSVHWGGNWGYAIPKAQREFAHALIEEAAVDVVHGHSSHHVRAMEVHLGRPILYGCGDFIDDYEGIAGEEAFRGDLGLMYLPQFDRKRGGLRALMLVPTRIRHFRVNRVDAPDRAWLLARLRRECRRFGCDVEPSGESFALRW